MTRHTSGPTALALAVAVALLATTTATTIAGPGGPLDPPAGPPTPVYKTLDQVEPATPINIDTTPGDANSLYRITTAGVYYLTGNIAPFNISGIEIAASNVVIDCRGFSISGIYIDGSGAVTRGIVTDGPRNDITIRNITSVASFTHAGIDLTVGGGGARCVVENVRSRLSPRGIVTGPNARVRDCHVNGHSDTGIDTGANSTVTDCNASACGVLNVGAGITVGDNSLVTRCVLDGNANFGIKVADACSVLDCTANANAIGIRVLDGCTVADCTARDNTIYGIAARFNSVIRDCTLSNTVGPFDAIVVDNNCRVIDNTCTGPGAVGSGIRAIGTRAVIEHNRIRGYDIGIEITGSQSLVIRNQAISNVTNYEIAANNRVAPIVIPPLSGAITSDTDPDVAGVATSDPFANFAY